MFEQFDRDHDGKISFDDFHTPKQVCIATNFGANATAHTLPPTLPPIIPPPMLHPPHHPGAFFGPLGSWGHDSVGYHGYNRAHPNFHEHYFHHSQVHPTHSRTISKHH